MGEIGVSLVQTLENVVFKIEYSRYMFLSLVHE